MQIFDGFLDEIIKEAVDTARAARVVIAGNAEFVVRTGVGTFGCELMLDEHTRLGAAIKYASTSALLITENRGTTWVQDNAGWSLLASYLEDDRRYASQYGFLRDAASSSKAPESGTLALMLTPLLAPLLFSRCRSM